MTSVSKSICAHGVRCIVLSLTAVVLLTFGACDKRPTSATDSSPATTPVENEPTTEPITPDEAPAPAEPTAAPDFDRHVIRLPGMIVVPPARDAAASPSGLIAPGDLDRDDATDLVVVIDRTSETGESTRQIVACSGADHSTLWAVDSPLETTTKIKDEESITRLDVAGLRGIPDINDDGIPDIFVAGTGERPGFATISGSDGRVIAMNSSPKDELIQLVDVRETTGDIHPDFIFATALEDERPEVSAKRIGFAVYSGDRLQRAVSFKKPFGRMQDRQALLFGPFPDSNNDGIDEILLYGVVPANRSRSDEAQFALVDGRRLKRWVLTRTEEDPVRDRAFVASPGDIASDGFADLVISTPADPDHKTPSRFGLYVLKKLNYTWVLRGNEYPPIASAAATEKTGSAEGGTWQFGAPVVSIPDMDGDSHRDLATTVLDSGSPDSRRLVVFSSVSGRVLGTFESGNSSGRIEAGPDRIQMTTFSSTSEGETTHIAVSGRLADGSDAQSAILLFDLTSDMAKANAGTTIAP